jgi:hypothetical protein
MIATLLIVSISGLTVPLPSYAAMIGTGAAVVSTDRQRIATFLDRGDVSKQLESYGVSRADAKARAAALSDEEAAKLAQQIDSAPAGGDGGAVIGALLIVALVLLLTDYLGYTHVYPFMKGHTRQ